MVEYHPISTRDQSTPHQFGFKALLGIFLEYELIAGRIWNGDGMTADLDDFDNGRISSEFTKRSTKSLSI